MPPVGYLLPVPELQRGGSATPPRYIAGQSSGKLTGLITQTRRFESDSCNHNEICTRLCEGMTPRVGKGHEP